MIAAASNAMHRKHKSFSEACERNRGPILEVLRGAFAGVKHVLEIGSGTGQHAVFFAEHLAGLTWQTSDVAAHHEGINAWIEDSGLTNVKPPLALDVRLRPWPLGANDAVDAIFSANTLHIMNSASVEAFFAGAGHVLPVNGMLVVYGPFNYGGRFTSESNARFDAMLRAQGVGSALRDFEVIDALARDIGLNLLHDRAMPANNRTLVWRRVSIPE